MCGHSFEEEKEEEDHELSAYDDDEGRHNIWNDLHHGPCLSVQNPAKFGRCRGCKRVGLTCRFASDCLCTEMYEFCHGP